MVFMLKKKDIKWNNIYKKEVVGWYKYEMDIYKESIEILEESKFF